MPRRWECRGGYPAGQRTRRHIRLAGRGARRLVRSSAESGSFGRLATDSGWQVLGQNERNDLLVRISGKRNLRELREKTADTDFLREVLSFIPAVGDQLLKAGT